MTMRDYTLRVRQDGTAELIDRAIDKSYDVIDVPSPHGDLVDKGELLRNMRCYYPSIDRICRSEHVRTRNDIEKTAVIIEAED
jgi:hypothetical protein